jgi:phosphoribulokinase
MDAKQPLMLGLIGDSASGKTTLVRGVVRLLGHNGVTPVCLDDYHRYSRAARSERHLTEADPVANDLSLMAAHLAALRAGGSIRKPVYDHRSGTLRDPETVIATGLVVAYGMLTLTPPALAALFDLTIYLEPDAALRQAWRLQRDVRERGYTPEEVMARRDDRERDGARFVAVQRPHAAMLLRFHGDPGGDPTAFAVELTLRRGAHHDLLDPALDALASGPVPGVSLARAITDEDGHRADRLLIAPPVSPEELAAAADLIAGGLPGLPPFALSILGQVREGERVLHSPALALTQLLIVRRLLGSG